MNKGYFVVICLPECRVQVYDISNVSETNKGEKEKKRNTKGREKRKDKHRGKQKAKRVIQRKTDNKMRKTLRMSKRKHAIIRTSPQTKLVLRKRKTTIRHKPSSSSLYTISHENGKR